MNGRGVGASRTVRIGCASGFWGDTTDGARQLVEKGRPDYLVFDYLAEITLSVLARMRAKDPDAGYVPDFIHGVIAPLAQDIASKKIKVVANAGGMNPVACKAELENVLAKAGVPLRVAAVVGDDVMPVVDAIRAEDAAEMFTGARMPERLLSANAYLGALPIAAALADGADIVITGRAVDSAVVLGPLMHEFGWSPDSYDQLAAGSLAGHIVECGCQATGGLFTDWRCVAADWADMGFPIVACADDGTFTVEKPDGTGGLITPETVAEQIVYEVGDPAAYLLPDVICDFSQVRLEQAGDDKVRVSGARGRPPTERYKVSATWQDGYRVTGTLMIGGFEAAAKATAVGEAILARCRRLFRDRNIGDFDDVDIEVLGAETIYGPLARAATTREVILKIGARHRDRGALEILAREIAPAATSMAQGITGLAGGRPRVQPVVRLFSFLLDKARVQVRVLSNNEPLPVPHPAGIGDDQILATPPVNPEAAPPTGDVEVPLIALAHGRSGDKGNKANIGILARRPAFLQLLRGVLTEAAVKDFLGHLVEGPVERFEWPGLNGFNFLLHDALGGGGVASLRHDPQGKTFAQILLAMPVAVPDEWLSTEGPLAEWAQQHDLEVAA